MGASAATVLTAQTSVNVSVTETLQGAPGASGVTVTSSAFNQGQQQYSPSTTVPVTKYSAAEYTLDGGGAATIDLTDLLGTQANIDGTGLKVQFIRVNNPSTNSGIVNVAQGASNPYPIWGSSNDMDVSVGGELSYRTNNAATISDVSGLSACEIDLAGTAGDVIKVELLLG